MPNKWPEEIKQAVLDAFAAARRSAEPDVTGSIDEYRRLASGGSLPEPKPAA
jgi:hypothetical protein